MYSDLTRGEIKEDLYKLEIQYEGLKLKIGTLLDEMEVIEKRYDEGKKELQKRG